MGRGSEVQENGNLGRKLQALGSILYCMLIARCGDCLIARIQACLKDASGTNADNRDECSPLNRPCHLVQWKTWLRGAVNLLAQCARAIGAADCYRYSYGCRSPGMSLLRVWISIRQSLCQHRSRIVMEGICRGRSCMKLMASWTFSGKNMQKRRPSFPLFRKGMCPTRMYTDNSTVHARCSVQ